MEHGEKQITVIDEQGNEVLCEVLFTFDSDQFQKSYVLYYPIGDTDEEEIEIHASSFEPNDENSEGELKPVESEEEWDLIEEMLNTFLDEEENE
ncbi:DUF1292 domain-containing protein [Jeotgalibacillus malaysiensis]|uniref:DUF1292 domain-containing protein n=1 Tax=Jeotgalibacillus malaysiensis TaxID=1508404 RepID=UPI00384FE649